MKRDILKELSEGSVSPEEAGRIYDAIMDAGKMDFAEALGLNIFEATAFGYGVELPELARWRKNGWPNYCRHCEAAIDIPKGGWIAKESTPGGDHFLKHLQCPSKGRGHGASAKKRDSR